MKNLQDIIILIISIIALLLSILSFTKSEKFASENVDYNSFCKRSIENESKCRLRMKLRGCGTKDNGDKKIPSSYHGKLTICEYLRGDYKRNMT